MILARSFRVQPGDPARLERRLGRPLDLPLGAQVVLVTGLDEGLARTLGGQGDAAVLAQGQPAPELIDRLLTPSAPLLHLRGDVVRFDDRPLVMGIVNVTPDSFSDGGRHDTTGAAIAHALTLLEEGADWLDIGGESTRPGAAPVPADEECARVVPVIEGLLRRVPGAIISVDTSKAEVARRALAAGACVVNDVTALGDPEMAGVIARAGASACLMHMQGTPRTMQQDPRYDDVVAEVANALGASLERAVVAGVDRRRLLVDPGLGFGKTLAHNLELLRHLDALRALGAPILLGASRKSFLGAITGAREPSQRLVASTATIAIAAALRQADVVRVHDVKATREALAIACAVRSA
ncbi:MAG: dihydropteroate synthase [Myxococcaceae bacterium]|nr:dihydropteroate synthase [Myxococcaceae bacterium]